jgi:hypothetical protein
LREPSTKLLRKKVQAKLTATVFLALKFKQAAGDAIKRVAKLKPLGRRCLKRR